METVAFGPVSVSQLNNYLKQRLDGDEALRLVCVEGEISNFTDHSLSLIHIFFLLQKYAIIHPLGVLGMSIIMANHLKKSFGVDVVLEDVSFHIDPGDKIALLGVNGAGKTTLFRLLTGELSADEGEIFLSRKLRIAYMQQHAEYSSTQTVLGAALEVFEPLRQKERQLQKLQQQLESGAQEDIIARYTACLLYTSRCV